MNISDYINDVLRRARDVAVDDLPKLAEEVAGSIDATIKGAITTANAHREARFQALSMVLTARKESGVPQEEVIREADAYAAFIAFGMLPPGRAEAPADEPADSDQGKATQDGGDAETAGEGAA